MTEYKETYMEGGPDRVWAYLQNKHKLENKGEFVIQPLDPLYADIASFYEVLMDRKVPQVSLQHAFPDHFKALSWYTGIHPSSSRWLLEALLLTDQSLEQIASVIEPGTPILALDVYKRAFFNVKQEHKDSLGWMLQYIWIPAMCRSNRLYYHDFILKVAGFYAGPSMVHEVAKPGKASPVAVNWIKDTALDQRMRSILTSAGSYGKLTKELQMPMTENALKAWEQMNREDGMNDTSSSSLGQLMDALETSIGLLDIDEKVPANYEFTSPKYEDHEIEGPHNE